LFRLFAFLAVLFIVVPIVELTLLLLFGQVTGSVLWPLVLVIGTGILGAALSRWQGAGVYWRIQSELRAGKLPTTSLLDGFLILIAGLLLITPGILSDLIGISLLIPPIRLLYRSIAIRWIKSYFKLPVFPMNGFAKGEPTKGDFGNENGNTPYRSQVIESYVIEKSEVSESGKPH
jgi:UPF0716 protein FxsA